MVEPTVNDIGRKVIYQLFGFLVSSNVCVPGFKEEGVITSFNKDFVFVRYGPDLHSKATRREDLVWSQTKTKE
jgi:hypothetical protein